MNNFWNDYPIIDKQLDEVRNQIRKNSKCKDKVIQESIIEMLESGGKMLRPAFVIIASKFGEYDEERTVAISAVIEMFHMATLVHDDVIDDAMLRRGKETVQAKHGKNYAVYIGDYLFCLCFKILATTSSIERGIELDTKVMTDICLGEVEQLNSRYDRNVTVKEYLKRISGKTAKLFSLSLYLGGAESKCTKKTCRLFWEIGHNIGMAFQIIDDILDYSVDSFKTGKDCSNDLKDGVYTLPLLMAQKKNIKELNDILDKKEYSDKDIELIMNIVRDSSAVEEAKALALKYTSKAFKNISKLPENEYRDILKEVTQQLLEREY